MILGMPAPAFIAGLGISIFVIVMLVVLFVPGPAERKARKRGF